MKVVFFYLLSLLFLQKMMAQDKLDYIKTSQNLLYSIRQDEPVKSFQDILASASPEELSTQLKTDNERKTFWLNIYNAFTQIGMQAGLASGSRNKFFANKFIVIAGEHISLDLIEHGILRRSKAKLSLGYFNKMFKTKFEKMFRVQKLDYRIHFALNCGAKSCPPIAFYKTGQMDKQLDLAAKAYLKNEVLFNGKDLTVQVPAIFSWFRRDFGGKKGIRKILVMQTLLPENVKAKIEWKKYDWTPTPKNFGTE